MAGKSDITNKQNAGRKLTSKKIKENLQHRIDFMASQIRENRIDHYRLKKELKKLLAEFETPEGFDW